MSVFILKTHNQTNYKMFAQVRLNGQCVLSIKTAIIMQDKSNCYFNKFSLLLLYRKRIGTTNENLNFDVRVFKKG